MKVLIDDLGRIVGTIDSKANLGDRIEYGGTRDGIKDIIGIATVRLLRHPNASQRIRLETIRHYDASGYMTEGR